MRLLILLLFPFLFAVDTQQIINTYHGSIPQYWGEQAPGVNSTLNTKEKVIALTLDACGGKTDGYDKNLIDFLRENHIPATLFINSRWIDKFPSEFQQLATNPLFEIENHGLNHLPCSINGKSAYGIRGTKSIPEIIDEVESNDRKIETLTGKKPHFYRSGTAFYDDIAVQIVNKLDYQVAGFSVLGDAGATFTAKQVETAVLSAKAGDIIICHMNHPESGTAEGLKAAIPQLLKQGYSFVLLKGYIK